MWGTYIHKTREGRKLPNGFDFPGKFTNKNHHSDKHKDFYDRFSWIIAKKSAETVYFVAPWNTGTERPQSLEADRIQRTRQQRRRCENSASQLQRLPLRRKTYESAKTVWRLDC